MPPQSSRAQSPTEMTRTWSPYFSPNSAIAPERTASSWVIISACTPRSAITRSLTRASTSAIADSGTAPVAEKSKRNRPGEFSEPGLGRGLAERLAERLVHHVGRGVRPADRGAPLDVDERLRVAAQGHLAVEHARLVHDQAGDRRLHVVDLEAGAVVELDDALVGELAAALGVERRAVEHQLDLVALARGLDRGAVADDAAHGALADHLGVAGEVDRADRWCRRCRGRRRRAPCWPFLALASARARSRCSPISRRKPSSSTREPLLGRHLQGQVDREAVGVVQRERLVAREHRAAAGA